MRGTEKKHGKLYRDDTTIRIVQSFKVDRCLAAELRKLNKLGIMTVYSCCGHGSGKGFIMVVRPCDEQMMTKLGYKEQVEYMTRYYTSGARKVRMPFTFVPFWPKSKCRCQPCEKAK